MSDRAPDPDLIAFARDFILPVLYPKPTQYNVAHFLAYAPFAAACILGPLLLLLVALRQRAYLKIAS